MIEIIIWLTSRPHRKFCKFMRAMRYLSERSGHYLSLTDTINLNNLLLKMIEAQRKERQDVGIRGMTAPTTVQYVVNEVNLTE